MALEGTFFCVSEKPSSSCWSAFALCCGRTASFPWALPNLSPSKGIAKRKPLERDHVAQQRQSAHDAKGQAHHVENTEDLLARDDESGAQAAAVHRLLIGRKIELERTVRDGGPGYCVLWVALSNGNVQLARQRTRRKEVCAHLLRPKPSTTIPCSMTKP
jgi:hypothetical protein